MATQLPDIVAKVKVDTSGLKDATADASKFGDQAQSKLSGVGKAALAAGAAFAAIKVGQFFSGAIANAKESRKILNQTNQVLETTGGIAGVTADQVGKVAGELSKITGIDDETIQSGQNLLLTFTNIRNEVGKGNDIFDQATTAAVDMSAALGQDLQSSVTMLGKALNDPIKGISAMSRAGVQFTEQQKEQIKTLVEAGDTMGAQKIILAELGTQFGGTAAAIADPSDKLAVTVDNLQQKFGDALLPVLDLVAKGATVLASALGAVPTPVLALGTAFIGIIGAMIAYEKAMTAIRGITILSTAATHLKKGAELAAAGATKALTAAQWLLNAAMTANPIGLVIAAIAALIAIFVLAWKHSDKFRQIVTAAFEAVKKAAGIVVDAIAAYFRFVFDAYKKIFEFLREAPGKIGKFFSDLARKAIDAGKNLISGLIEGIKDKAGDLIEAVKEFITDPLPGFVKKALGIESPSKVFAQFGRDITAGLASGIAQGASKPIGVMSSLTSGLSAVGSANLTGLGGGGRVINLNMNSSVVHESSASALRHELRKQAYLGTL